MTELLVDETLVAKCERCQEEHVLHARMPAGSTVHWTAAYCETCREITVHRWHRESVNDHD